MSWRGPAFSTLLIGLVYWGVRPLLVASLSLQVYIAGLIAISLLVGAGTAWWQSRHAEYVCGNCDHLFNVSVGRHLIGQNWFGRVQTRCPSCEQTGWCSPVPSPTDTPSETAGV